MLPTTKRDRRFHKKRQKTAMTLQAESVAKHFLKESVRTTEGAMRQTA